MKYKFFTPSNSCNWACHALQHLRPHFLLQRAAHIQIEPMESQRVLFATCFNCCSKSLSVCVFFRRTKIDNFKLCCKRCERAKCVKLQIISFLFLAPLSLHLHSLCSQYFAYMRFSSPAALASFSSLNKWRSPCHWTEVGLRRSGGGRERVKSEGGDLARGDTVWWITKELHSKRDGGMREKEGWLRVVIPFPVRLALWVMKAIILSFCHSFVSQFIQFAVTQSYFLHQDIQCLGGCVLAYGVCYRPQLAANLAQHHLQQVELVLL